MRQHRHRRPALTLFADFAARRHIRLPEFGSCRNQVVYDIRQLDSGAP
jgi:hypothetical protein